MGYVPKCDLFGFTLQIDSKFAKIKTMFLLELKLTYKTNCYQVFLKIFEI